MGGYAKIKVFQKSWNRFLDTCWLLFSDLWILWFLWPLQCETIVFAICSVTFLELGSRPHSWRFFVDFRIPRASILGSGGQLFLCWFSDCFLMDFSVPNALKSTSKFWKIRDLKRLLRVNIARFRNSWLMRGIRVFSWSCNLQIWDYFQVAMYSTQWLK